MDHIVGTTAQPLPDVQSPKLRRHSAANGPSTRTFGGWVDGRTVELEGLRVILSQPVLVGRSRGWFWFPNLWLRPSGDLLATISPVADIHQSTIPYLAMWSRDGGLTWSEPTVVNDGGQTLLERADRDALLLPYILRPRPGGVGAPYNRIPAGRRTFEYVQTGILVTGLPGKDRPPIAGLDVASWSFNGQTLRLTDGHYLATIYGRLEDKPGYRILAVTSADGVRWRASSLIADATSGVRGVEGPNESAIARMPDGRIMCVFRVGSGSSLGQTWSSDEGRTWSPPCVMHGVFSVQPSIAVLANGTVALSSGRPGCYLWLDASGEGRRWQRIDLLEHHNALVPDEPIRQRADLRLYRTSSYTEVVAVDPRHLLIIYDRLPNGWRRIPESMSEANSVWLVRATVDVA
jgi:hypothetical protein